MRGFTFLNSVELVQQNKGGENTLRRIATWNRAAFILTQCGLGVSQKGHALFSPLTAYNMCAEPEDPPSSDSTHMLYSIQKNRNLQAAQCVWVCVCTCECVNQRLISRCPL